MVTFDTYYSDMHYGDGPRQAVVGILVPLAVPAGGYTLVVNWSTGASGGWTDGMPRLYLTPVGTSMNAAQTQVDTGTEVEVAPDSYVAGTDLGGAAAWVATYTLTETMVTPYANASTDPHTEPCLVLRTNFAKTPFSFTTWRPGDWITLPTTGSFVGNSGPMAQVTTAGGGASPPVITAVATSPAPYAGLVTITGTDFGATRGTVSWTGDDGEVHPLGVVSWADTSIVVSSGWPLPETTDLVGSVTVTNAIGSDSADLTISAPPPPPPGAARSGGGPFAPGISGPGFGMPSTGSRPRSSPGPTTPLFAEHRALFAKVRPSLVVTGLAIDMPPYAGVSASSGTLTPPDIAAEIADAMDVNLGADHRWIAGDTYHADGSGTVWEPRHGTRNWTSDDVALAPYLDPAFEVPSRREPDDIRPALIFDGGRYLKLPARHSTTFTIAMVTRLMHPPSSGYSDLLSSPSAATDATRGLDLDLRFRGGALRAHTGRVAYCDIDLVLRSRPSAYRNGNELRPMIVVWSQGPKYFQLGLLTARQRLTMRKRLTKPVPAAGYDLGLYLGRNGAVFNDASTAHMQLLEMAMWDSVLSVAGIRAVMNKLNGIYGVR